MNRLEAFAAAAVTGLTSGGSSSLHNAANVARQAFDIARALDELLSQHGYTEGAPRVIHLHHQPPMQAPPPAQPMALGHTPSPQAPMGPPVTTPAAVLGPNMPGLPGQGMGMSFPPMPGSSGGMPSPTPGQAMAAGMVQPQVDVSPKPGGMDYQDANPESLPNREAMFWRKRMPRLPYRPHPDDTSVQANKARTARTITIQAYKEGNPQWKGEYMNEVGEPPPEAMVI